MIIGTIVDGIVIDHIPAGRAMDLYRDLGLDKLECEVAVIKNASSGKYGKKDILKINEVIDLNYEMLGYIDPHITVNIIRGESEWRRSTPTCRRPSPGSSGARIPGASPPSSRNCPTSSVSPTGSTGCTAACTVTPRVGSGKGCGLFP